MFSWWWQGITCLFLLPHVKRKGHTEMELALRMANYIIFKFFCLLTPQGQGTYLIHHIYVYECKDVQEMSNLQCWPYHGFASRILCAYCIEQDNGGAAASHAQSQIFDGMRARLCVLHNSKRLRREALSRLCYGNHRVKKFYQESENSCA